MEQAKYVLNAIPEDNSSSESGKNLNSDDKLCVELTFYPDTMPSIKSYYIMTPTEYEELNGVYMDIYIENFINDEDLTKDKLDIYLIHNSNNAKIIKNFINNFGNPFDIINLINAKRKQQSVKSERHVHNIDTITDNYSESESDSDTVSTGRQCEEVSEPIQKPKQQSSKPNLTSQYLPKQTIHSSTKSIVSKTKHTKSIKNINQDIHFDSDSDSEAYIDTMTEIIDIYNKSKKIDNDKIKKITSNRPELLKDVILNELTNNMVNNDEL
jgi:hypothetical protein